MDRPTLRGRRPIVADERDPDNPRKKHAAYQNGSKQTPLRGNRSSAMLCLNTKLIKEISL